MNKVIMLVKSLKFIGEGIDSFLFPNNNNLYLSFDNRQIVYFHKKKTKK